MWKKTKIMSGCAFNMMYKEIVTNNYLLYITT